MGRRCIKRERDVRFPSRGKAPVLGGTGASRVLRADGGVNPEAGRTELIALGREGSRKANSHGSIRLGKRDRQWKERGSVCRTLFGLTDGLGGRNSKNATAPRSPVNDPKCIRVPAAGGVVAANAS